MARALMTDQVPVSSEYILPNDGVRPPHPNRRHHEPSCGREDMTPADIQLIMRRKSKTG